LPGRAPQPHKEDSMHFYVGLQPLISLAAGIAILAVPRLLNYIVAAYLIFTGIFGLVRF